MMRKTLIAVAIAGSLLAAGTVSAAGSASLTEIVTQAKAENKTAYQTLALALDSLKDSDGNLPSSKFAEVQAAIAAVCAAFPSFADVIMAAAVSDHKIAPSTALSGALLGAPDQSLSILAKATAMGIPEGDVKLAINQVATANATAAGPDAAQNTRNIRAVFQTYRKTQNTNYTPGAGGGFQASQS